MAIKRLTTLYTVHVTSLLEEDAKEYTMSPQVHAVTCEVCGEDLKGLFLFGIEVMINHHMKGCHHEALEPAPTC